MVLRCDLVDMLLILKKRYEEMGEAGTAAKYRREAAAVWDAISREEGEDFASDWDDGWLEKTVQALKAE